MIHRTPILVSLFVVCGLLLPSVSFASTTLTPQQASAIVGLLQVFGVDQAVLLRIEQILGLLPASVGQSVVSDLIVSSQPPVPHIPTTGSPYPSSTLGFDLSFATTAYPSDGFNFGIVSITRGKAFVDNGRFASEYPWAKFGSHTPPTIYMNLNAPYGSTVAGHTASPKVCPPSDGSSTEPTACEGYNYGYTAAQHSYAYAKSNGASSAQLWWLDIEEENSWSNDLSVNDATIQGAIDYLNTQGIRVGIYSMTYMWNTIAGSTFIPSQTLNGNVAPVPLWVPVGIMSQVGAINSCITKAPFITGSPVWIIQYEASSTAIDQNLAC